MPLKKHRVLARLAVLFLMISVLSGRTVQAQEDTGRSESQMTLSTVVTGYPAMVEDAQAAVTLPDGTTVTAEGASLPDGLLLVVDWITADDEGLLSWIEGLMQGLGTNLRVYGIYFVDSQGERYEVAGQISISISLHGDYGNPVVYYVSPEGSTERMDSTVGGDVISFSTTHNSYYVLAEAPSVEDTEPETETSGRETPETESGTGTGTQSGSSSGSTGASAQAVKTGDDTPVGLYAGMLLAAGAVLLICLAYRRKPVN